VVQFDNWDDLGGRPEILDHSVFSAFEDGEQVREQRQIADSTVQILVLATPGQFRVLNNLVVEELLQWLDEVFEWLPIIDCKLLKKTSGRSVSGKMTRSIGKSELSESEMPSGEASHNSTRQSRWSHPFPTHVNFRPRSSRGFQAGLLSHSSLFSNF
jgi:hypothetical protein